MTPSPDLPPEESTGFPGFRTWRALHVFVLVFAALLIVLLSLFTRAFAP